MASLVPRSRSRFLFAVVAASLAATISWSPASWAKDGPWMPPGHGYVIEVKTSEGIPQSSGQPAHILGTIQFVGDSHGKRDNKGRCHPDPKFKPWRGPDHTGPGHKPCPALPKLTDQLEEDDLSVEAFFPDATNVVTEKVKLSGTEELIQFSFDAPALKGADLNQFTIQLIHTDPEIQGLQKTQAKLAVHIHQLDELILKLQKEHAPSVAIQAAQTARDALAKVLAKVEKKIEGARTMIAQAVFPLQVDNRVAASGKNVSVQGHYRTVISTPSGSSIEGEKAQLHVELTHLPDYEADDGECDWHFKKDDQVAARLYWNGVKLTELGPKVVEEGTSLSYDFETSKLQSAQANELVADLHIWHPKKKTYGKQLSHLAYRQPVAKDSVAPQWLAGGTPSSNRPYVQAADPVALLLQDAFGRIDPSSLHAKLTGTRLDGTPVDRDMTALLLMTPAGEEGEETQLVSGDLNPLDEGAYTFAVQAKDRNGNTAQPAPYSASFRVDRSAPKLSLSRSGKVFTNADHSDFTLTVSDLSPFRAKVLLDGALALESGESPIAVQVPLSEGSHVFTFQAKDEAGNEASGLPALEIVRDSTPPGITLGILDPALLSRPDPVLSIALTDATEVKTTVSVNGIAGAELAGNSLLVPLLLQEGLNRIEVKAIDAAGNSSVSILGNVTVDTLAPTLFLGQADHQLLTQPGFSLPVTVSDASATLTRVLQNGVEVASSGESSFTVPVSLKQGLNIIEVTSVDAVGHASAPVVLSDIVLDSVAPSLMSLSPAPGTTFQALSFEVKGQSDERLSGVRVNGKTLSLSSDGLSFAGVYTAATEGPLSLHLEAFDLAGNVAVRDISVSISLKVLNPALLTVAPDPDGQHLVIFGAPGATRAGLTVQASAGFFNQGSAVGASDGSFSIRLDPFTSATLTATDPVQGRTETATVTFGSAGGTLLSGRVRDTSDQPLSGVTVTIAGSGLKAVTDGSGVFSFSAPVTGDQKLIVDGGTIPASETGPARKFGKTVVSITVGLSQSNVMERPIYLAPMPLLTSPEVEVASGGEISHPDAPGVTLDIPAQSIQFPDGKPSGQISIASIPARVSTIPVPEFAAPARVLALEPSGTHFKKPVDVTLPNDLGLSPGVETVILSMNSSTGAWEIDGTAKVSEDGQSIVTKPGQGITHFSLIYAAPLAPVMRAIGSQDKPGADSMNGGVSTTLSLPSYQSLGKEIRPSLIYRSSWAKPSVLLTNLFDIPRQEAHIQQDSTPTETIRHPGGLQRQVCVPKKALGFIPTGAQECHFEPEDLYELLQYYVHEELDSWYEPDSITAQFFSGPIVGAPLHFENTPATPIPGRATLAYGLELKDPSTQEYLPSGIYPYRSSYEVRIRQMLIKTRKVTASSALRPPQVVVNDEKVPETRDLNEVFPSDVGGTLHVQNKIRSEAGRGWKIGGMQTIVNPTEDRVVIEEADGSTSDFVLQNTINTLYTATAPVDLSQGANVSQWPNAYVTLNSAADAKSAGVLDLSLQTPSLTNLGSITPLVSGKIVSGVTDLPPGYPCPYRQTEIRVGTTPADMLRQSPGGPVIGTSQSTHGLFSVAGGGVSLLGARDPMGVANCIYSWFSSSQAGFDAYTASDSCVRDRVGQLGVFGLIVSSAPAPVLQLPQDYPVGFGMLGCSPLNYHNPNIAVSTILAQKAGFSEGALPASHFNTPMGMTLSPQGDLVIADYGNHRVRRIDHVTQQVQTIAGIGQTFDSGDGMLATQASLYHPRALAYDSIGNLYIATENGYIRKVDTAGRISTIAGLPLPGESRVLADKTPASQLFLDQPNGLAMDSSRGYLYVSDTRHHRVVRIDLNTSIATTVVGSGNSSPAEDDGLPALAANLNQPQHIGLDPAGNLLIVDAGHNRIIRANFENTHAGQLAFQLVSETNPGVRKNPNGSWVPALVRNGDGTWTRNYRNGDRAIFDVGGHQIRAVDRVGREASFAYDGQGRIQAMTDPVGRSTQYHYVGNQLRSTTDPAGRTTYFEYGSNGTLNLARLPDGTERHYAYDADGLMLSETNERGLSTRYEYNEWNRLKSVTQPDLTKIELTDAGSAAAASSQQGVMKPQGSGEGEIGGILRDARSVETKFVKDFRGYVSTVVDAEGKVTEIRRDRQGRPTLLLRPDKTEATFTYDAATGDLLAQQDTASGISTSRTYDEYGNVLTETNGRGFQTRTIYDSRGLPISQVDPLQRETKVTYNSFGQVLARTNPLNQVTTSVYDAFGNVASATDALSHSSSFTYDAAGNVLTARNPLGQVTQYEYDPMNRLTAVISAKNERTEYSYLPTGQLSQVKDALGHTRTYEYDLLGRMLKLTDALGNITTRKYDAGGNVVEETDPNGNVKSFVYDTGSRLTKKTLPDNVYEMAYDFQGRLKSTKDQATEVLFSYDVAGRPLAIRSHGLGSAAALPDVTLGFTHDANGNRLTMTDPRGTTSYAYDTVDRLTQIQNPKGEVYTYGFDAGNRMLAMTRPGSSSAFAFDDANFIASVIHSSGGSPLASFTYSHNAAGKRTAVATPEGTREFTYDSLSQLTGATNPEAPQSAQRSEAFEYDSIQNRTRDQGGSYTYDGKAQRLQEDYRYFYFYDHNGNLTSKQAKGLTGEVTNFSYSSENQLLSLKVYVPGSNDPIREVSYLYDALGRRVQKKVIDHRAASDDLSKSYTHRYAYDGENLILQYDGSNQLLAYYTHRPVQGNGPVDDVLGVEINSSGVEAKLATRAGSYQYLKDGHGSVTDVADAQGARIQHYIYSAFGTLLGIQDALGADVTAAPPVNTAYAFAGRELDSESGLYYNRARYFDPESGRFLQRDPHPGKLNLPSTVVNSYIYSLNDPVNRLDPSGKFSWIERAIIAVVAVVVAVVAVVLSPVTLGASSLLGKIAVGALIGAITGGVAGGATGVLINKVVGRPWDDNLGEAVAIGAIAGGIAGGTVGAFDGLGAGLEWFGSSSSNSQLAWSNKTKTSCMAGPWSIDCLGEKLDDFIYGDERPGGGGYAPGTPFNSGVWPAGGAA